MTIIEKIETAIRVNELDIALLYRIQLTTDLNKPFPTPISGIYFNVCIKDRRCACYYKDKTFGFEFTSYTDLLQHISNSQFLKDGFIRFQQLQEKKADHLKWFFN